MAKQRDNPPAILEALDRAAAPAYLVDPSRVITYANDAVSRWVDVPRDDLVGRRVEYHSEASDSADGELIAGLCPSPASMAGRRDSGIVTCTGLDRRLRSRTAEFLPMTPAGDTVGGDDGSPVLVTCAAEDLSPTEVAKQVQAASTPGALHLALQAFRAESSHLRPPPCLLGVSLAAQRLRRQVEALAMSGANGLIRGAADDGVEDVALYAYHRSSPNAADRLLARDARLLSPDQVIESVTGVRDASESGQTTLVVTNADALPTDGQARLADAVAGERSVRLYACVSPTASIDERLASVAGVVTLAVPLLAERREDLPLLGQWAIEQQNALGGRQIAGLAPDAIEALALYSWPGGLRQLEEVVADSHGRGSSAVIQPADMPMLIRQAGLAASLPPKGSSAINLESYLANVERELMTRVLAEASGNKAEAARLLGMTRPRLYRRLTALGLLESETTESQAPALSDPIETADDDPTDDSGAET